MIGTFHSHLRLEPIKKSDRRADIVIKKQLVFAGKYGPQFSHRQCQNPPLAAGMSLQDSQ